VPSQELGHGRLRESVLANQRVHDPGFLQRLHRPGGRVQRVDRRFRRRRVGLQAARPDRVHPRHLARRRMPLEAVQQQQTPFRLADHHRRKLTIPPQRLNHRLFSRAMHQPIAAVVQVDLRQGQPVDRSPPVSSHHRLLLPRARGNATRAPSPSVFGNPYFRRSAWRRRVVEHRRTACQYSARNYGARRGRNGRSSLRCLSIRSQRASRTSTRRKAF